MTKLGWYWRRLRMMSLPELGYRLWGKVVSLYERLEYVLGWYTPCSFRPLGTWLFCRQDLHAIRELYARHPAWNDRLIAEAERVADHRISLFSLQHCSLGSNIEWHKDYKSGLGCAPVYYSRINYRDYHRLGEIKYIWQLSRFPHFFTLANAFMISGNSRYAEAILDQMASWLDSNPYLVGIHWTSSLELTHRLIAWLWALKSLEVMDYPIPQELGDRIMTSIFQQARYISRHISAYSSANNHRIGEFLGLFVTGMVLDFGKTSRQWVSRAYHGLLEELERQIGAEGFNKEQAVAYHSSVLEFYLMLVQLMRCHQKQLPDWAMKRIESMIDVLQAFRDEGGNDVQIGDNDDACLLPLVGYRSSEFVFNTGALLFQRGDFKRQGGEVADESMVWFLGPRSWDGYHRLPASSPPDQNCYLKEAGYVVFRSPDVHAVVDVAPLGYLSIAAHGHADALALTLSYRKKAFLVDPGTCTYAMQSPLRDYFRSTAAHNTVCVDGKNQSRIGGTFMWLEKAVVRDVRVDLNVYAPSVSAWHDGYLRRKIGVRHARQVAHIPDMGIVVMDILDSRDSKAHDFARHWHFHPNCLIEPRGDAWWIWHDDTLIQMYSDCSIPVQTDVLSGQEDPFLGWFSNRYDSKMPAPAIRTTLTSNAAHIVLFTWFGFGKAQWTCERSQQGWILTSSDKRIEIVSLSPGKDGFSVNIQEQGMV